MAAWATMSGLSEGLGGGGRWVAGGSAAEAERLGWMEGGDGGVGGGGWGRALAHRAWH